MPPGAKGFIGGFGAARGQREYGIFVPPGA